MHVILRGGAETFKNSIALTYMLAAGMIFGAFVGYLSTAQQIFQIQYEVGDAFSIYFGVLAIALGLAGFINSKLVMKYKMETICWVSLSFLSLVSFGFYFYSQGFGGHPSLTVLMIYFWVTFFFIGLLFGNFNTLALQPLGHIAGTANSVIGATQTFISMAIGGAIGQSYDGSVQPLVFGFLICGVVSLIILLYHRRKSI